jgi:hypothetical protein
MAEWINLTSGKEVFDRQAEGWEIEVYKGIGQWEPWLGNLWTVGVNYRGRPKQPKPKVVTSECWRNSNDGSLIWRKPPFVAGDIWERVPAWDFKDGEVKA